MTLIADFLNLAILLVLVRLAIVFERRTGSTFFVKSDPDAAVGPSVVTMHYTDRTTTAADDAAVEKAFAVARRERRPSWRERRRELEAKHRTERKKLEEWRD